VSRFIASVSPTNEPSLRLIANLGFVRTGEQWDELDGEEYVFELVRGES
jgi:RimJ/RimL family protein N-acetyltransferase